MKTFSLRLADEQAADLAAVARANGNTVSAEIRLAIDTHVARRLADPDFQRRLRVIMEREAGVLERLARS